MFPMLESFLKSLLHFPIHFRIPFPKWRCLEHMTKQIAITSKIDAAAFA